MAERNIAHTKYTDEQIKKVFADLEDPFDPDLLYWKPQATNKDKTQAMVAVYADPRAYSDRLNDVVGAGGWHESYSAIVVPFKKESFEWGEAKGEKKIKLVEGHKVIVTCTVTIDGIGEHTDVGEEETGNENVATAAYAQAFKRACVKFGLGRYLYDFPKGQWCPYDKNKKQVTQPPAIPDWAMPRIRCEDCSEIVGPYVYKAKVKDAQGNVTGEEDRTMSASQVLQRSKAYGAKLCGACMAKRAESAKSASGGRL